MANHSLAAHDLGHAGTVLLGLPHHSCRRARVKQTTRWHCCSKRIFVSELSLRRGRVSTRTELRRALGAAWSSRAAGCARGGRSRGARNARRSSSTRGFREVWLLPARLRRPSRSHLPGAPREEALPRLSDLHHERWRTGLLCPLQAGGLHLRSLPPGQRQVASMAVLQTALRCSCQLEGGVCDHAGARQHNTWLHQETANCRCGRPFCGRPILRPGQIRGAIGARTSSRLQMEQEEHVIWALWGCILQD
mmetsp:Transcript_14580/g.25613  ORF Transcript_14580/g.25613 Transcript_14580/m.25613 type:complete len:250 (+) Transcript_14580:78-827(+)